MKSILTSVFSLIVFVSHSQAIIYPETKTQDLADNYFGKSVSDPYRWLEYDTAIDVQEWGKEQNRFAEKYLKKRIAWSRIRNGIYKFAPIKVGSAVTSPNDYFFYRSDGALGIGLYFKSNGFTQLVMRPKKYGYHKQISFFTASKDKRNVAIGLSESGSDWDEVHIKNLEAETKYPEIIEGIKFNTVIWHGHGFYYWRYSLPDKKKRLTSKNDEVKVFFHRLGEDQQKDKLIYSENIPGNAIRISTTKDERFLIIYGNELRNHQLYTKLMYIDSSTPGFAEPRVFLSVPQADFEVIDNVGDSLVLLSTYKARNRCIFTCNPKKINKLNLLISEYKVPLTQASIVDNKLVCLYKENANTFSVVFDWKGNVMHKMSFPLGSSVTGFNGTKDEGNTYYRFNTFTYPPVTYQYNLKNFVTGPASVTTIQYDYTKFVTTQEFYTSKDGTKIPIYIVQKKDLKPNGNSPCIIYGYGGFGTSMTPFFEPGMVYFLEKGGVLAAPCIRGGGEYGESWHKGGSLLNKQNSFNDFIAAAEFMITRNYTNSRKLAMMGGSNGGLLVGAVMTQFPELFRAAVANVGVFDMLRYQHYTVGHMWSDEYGLSSDSIQFNNLITYSPLQNVKQVSYPSTLLITGDHDDRVPPMHSYKFAAALQKSNAGPNPILLLINKHAGHNGPDEYDDYIEQQVFKYGFILSELNEND